MNLKVIVISLAFIFISGFVYANGTLTWGAVGDYDLYGDPGYAGPLKKGCLVQLILDRNGDGLDPIDYSGSIYPAGDDVLLPVLEGDSTARVGDGLPPFNKDGQLWVTVVFDNASPGENYTGYRVYVRFWDSDSPGVDSGYGEAGPFVLEAGLRPQEINVTEFENLCTDKVLFKGE